jgi:hypothetical protein
MFLSLCSKIKKMAKYREFNDARSFVRSLNLKNGKDWREYIKNKPKDIPSNPDKVYKTEWINVGDWLGTSAVASYNKEFVPYQECKKFCNDNDIKTQQGWDKFKKENGLPYNIPKYPAKVYKDKGWKSWGDFTGYISPNTVNFMSYEEAKKITQDNNIKSREEWKTFIQSNEKPVDFPITPNQTYRNKGWEGWTIFFGKNGRTSKKFGNHYLTYNECEKFVRNLKLSSLKEWGEYISSNELPSNIPHYPNQQYKNEGWVSWSCFLNIKTPAPLIENYEEAEKIINSLNLKRVEDWRKLIKENRLPDGISTNPDKFYKDKGWISWTKWLGVIGNGNHNWTKLTLLHFINSLKFELVNLNSIELITIINSNNLAQKLERLGTLNNLISSRSGSQERQEVVNEILNIVENINDDIIVEDVNVEITTVEDILTQEQIDNIVSTQEQDEELPRVNVIEEMKVYDNNMLTASLDDENVDFLLKNGLKKIWVEVLSNRFDVELYRTEKGGDNFNIIKGWFFSEYDEAMGLQLPKDYHFKDNKGNILSPNLMQRLIALRTIREKSYGNWSDTGTGKTLSGLLTGRIHAEKTGSGFTTLIVCNNATVGGWEKSINEYFIGNNIYNKSTLGDMNNNSISQEPLGDKSGKNDYIIVNYEKFQQKDSEMFAYNLVHNYNIGYVILDEVHNIKQREVENESIRRNNVVKLITALREKNPNLMLSAMSATPIINNFYEPKAIIELLTGEIHKEIETTENIQNGIELYKLLTRHGLRYKGIKFVKENTDIRRINGNHLREDINGLTAGDLLKTEQILLQDKLVNIKDDIKKGTLIYTHYITGLKNNIGEYVKNLGFTVGYYTGGDKEGLQLFKDGKVDVLIGSTPVGTGVDGIQKVCDRMIILNLPWTNADFKQLKGRVIDRTGCIFDKVDVIIPQVYMEDDNGNVIWDWDNWRYERVKFKKTLMDLVLDGEIPEGKLPSKQKLLQDALVQLGIWKERIENGEILTTQREELKVPLNPEVVERLQRKLGDFSEMNRVWSVSNSTTTGERLKDSPEEWYQYHTLYRERREEWNEIPYEVIGKKISSRPDWVVGDFGCGENLLSKEITNKVHSFDHIAIDETVTACDISNVPLSDNILDVVVFSLSLMGTNYRDYLEEGHRTLRPFGLIMICEPKSKWEGRENELVDVLKEIGFTANIERTTDKFIYIEGNKRFN